MIFAGARRLLSRVLVGFFRRALLMLCLWPAGAFATETIIAAGYESPTGRYPHAVLGDALEYGTLAVTLTSGSVRRFVLPDSAVFEDTEPRLVDLDEDNSPELLVVESDQRRGARLAVYGPAGRITATPYIGTRFRWLAPVGAADLDGDGRVEVAYVDRPHLAKTLRVWRYENQQLTQVATKPGVTNHRIGETDIAGGIRTCAGRPEMILSDATWGRLLALRFAAGEISAQPLGDDTSRAAFARAMRCQDEPV